MYERIGEKHSAQLTGEGACQPDIFTKYRLGCALSYGTCPISVCALYPLSFKVVLWPNSYKPITRDELSIYRCLRHLVCDLFIFFLQFCYFSLAFMQSL